MLNNAQTTISDAHPANLAFDACARNAVVNQDLRHGSLLQFPTKNDANSTVATSRQQLKFAPGETIIWEMDAARYFYEIVSGTVSLANSMADGRRQILDFLSVGDRFGLCGSDSYAYTVEAVTEVTVARHQCSSFEEWVGREPRVAMQLLTEVMQELRTTQNQILLLGRKSASEKVSSFLLMMAGRAAQYGLKMNTVHLPMRRPQIADYLGLSVETVCRVFTRLKRDGLITLPSPSQVVITHVETLRGIADGIDAREQSH